MATLHEIEFLEAMERITPQWVAGFFDGEGCVAVVRQQRGIPSLIVNISQAEYNILYLIGLKFGREPYKKYAKNAKRQGWSLAFAGKSAIPFLEYIRPHVVLKRKLVEWALELANLHGVSGGNRRSKGFESISAEAWEKREELLKKIRSENQAGKFAEGEGLGEGLLQ